MTTRSQRGYSIRAQPTAGSWLVIVSAGIDPHTRSPRQVRKVVHATTEAKAHKAAQKILPELHERADAIRANAALERELSQPGAMTVERLTDQWLQARRTKGNTATTLAQYEANGARWCKGLGKRAAANLSAEDIDMWVASLRNARGEPLAASTRRQILGDLHNCLTWGHEKRGLPIPPTTHATRPGHTKKSRELPDVDVFLDAVDALEAIGSDVAGMALLALGQGLREGEVCGLRWQDVGPRLRVAGALKRDGTWGETKGRRERVMPISAIGKKGIDLAERLADDSSPWLWPRPTDPELARRPDWLSKQWKALAPVVGLDGLTFHGLRHAAGSTLLRGGVPVPVVSEILGHADSRVTMEVYAHVMGGLADNALDPIDDAYTRRRNRDE